MIRIVIVALLVALSGCTSTDTDPKKEPPAKFDPKNVDETVRWFEELSLEIFRSITERGSTIDNLLVEKEYDRQVDARVAMCTGQKVEWEFIVDRMPYSGGYTIASLRTRYGSSSFQVDVPQLIAVEDGASASEKAKVPL